MAQMPSFQYVFLIALYLSSSRAVVIRNKALMNKMMTHFQGKNSDVSIEAMKNTQSTQQRRDRETAQQDVMSLMQNVLCRNFPSIPCELIVQDGTLNRLIQKSIQQIKHKKIALEKTTPPAGARLTLFPIIDGEDLSNFLQASETGHYKEKRKERKAITMDKRTHEKGKRKKKESKVIPVYNGRKKIRRFYPHKIKYKEKAVEKFTKDFVDLSEENISMSVERAEGNYPKKMTFHPDEPPVWRIDYMKHGEPNLNMFGYDADRLKGKIMKTGPNVIVDENVLEQVSRKDVLHPDVYIKKNFVRKNNVDANSDTVMD